MSLRIAYFGQAPFGKDVLDRLVDAGHRIVAAYVPPDGARPDPTAARAAELGIPLLRYKRFRKQGQADPAILEEYRALDVELNVLAFVTAILPPEIVDGPAKKSLCFHPSLLPRFRGGAALAWQIIEGEKESGVTVFQPDAGVDTGPIVVQRGGVTIAQTHTAASLYFDHLYALGVDAMVDAVEAVAKGSATYQVQDESRATHQGLVDDEVARIDWSKDAAAIDRLVRGCDPQPGAWAILGDDPVRLHDGCLLPGGSDAAPGSVLGIEEERLVIAAQGGRLGIGRLRLGDGKKGPAAEAGIAEGARLV
jgi:methionyl-tRNA formyltransferase